MVLRLSGRKAVLERALVDGWDLFFEHDPEVAVAGLAREDGRLRLVRAGPL